MQAKDQGLAPGNPAAMSLTPVLLIAVVAGGTGAPLTAEVLLATSPGSSPGNWGALPALLGGHAPLESRDDGTLPGGDLSRYRMVVLSTDLNAFLAERERLWDYVRRGGRLVTWFPDDRRSSPSFFPFRLVLSDQDPPQVTFRDVDHPLLAGLRGATFTGRLCGGDVVRDWDRDHWQVLADSPAGPALLLCSYGEGWILDVQFHAPLTAREDLAGPLADNLISWAGVRRVSPEELAHRDLRDVLLLVARRNLHALREGRPVRGSWEDVQASQTPVGLRWSYPWGVTLYGLLRVGEVTGDEDLTRFVLRHNELAAAHYDYLRWQRRTFGKTGPTAGLAALLRLSSLDDCGSMASQAVEGLLLQGEGATPEMRAMLGTVADYTTHQQSRLPDGSLCRRSTLWIDDLYMSVPFLARWGTFTGQSWYLDDAARQIISFSSRLQDSDGLWFHGWFNRERRPSPYKWGRGNGWAMMATVAVLGQLPEDHPARPRLLVILGRHIEGLKRVQAPSGLWRQVLDRPELWEETSCTGMFAFGIARACNRGWVSRGDLPVAEKAVEALKTRVAWEGSVLGTCAGTGIGRDLQYYVDRPRPVNDGHGPGPVMLAGAEMLAARR